MPLLPNTGVVDPNDFGKGALQDPEQLASSRFSIVEEPFRAINWNAPYSIEQGFKLVDRDQDGSSSCTAQATCYYAEALNKIEHNQSERYSARFNYSQSFAPGGGAYIWKAMSIPLTKGVASYDSVPDGNSTEPEMTDASMNGSAIIEAKTDRYAQIPNKRNIDWLAQVIQDYHGFITGFNGRNDMFNIDGTVNVPVGPTDWGHAVYVTGYEVRNGKRVLRFKNSWSKGWGDENYGYFPEEFILNGPIFDAYVYADVLDLNPSSISMNEEQLNNLWLAVFKRPIDAPALAFYKDKSFNNVIDDLLKSNEHKFYEPIFKAAKAMEDAVRSGQL